MVCTDTPRETPTAVLPEGGIIGLWVAAGLPPKLNRLLVLLMGSELTPMSGTCESIGGKVWRVDSETNNLMRGSLWTNLTYGTHERYGIHKDVPPTAAIRDAVWEVCRLVGLSPRLIGDAPTSGWEDVEVRITPHEMRHEDETKVALVRALLNQPDVLLLHGVGDSWSEGEQTRLLDVIRAFMASEIEMVNYYEASTTRESARKKHEERHEEDIRGTVRDQFLFQECEMLTARKRRTVIWSTSHELIERACCQKDDAVLLLASPSKGILQSVDMLKALPRQVFGGCYQQKTPVSS